jgi:hypothetical protein
MSIMTPAIGFVLDKAPKGGYKLSRITGLDGGQITAEVVAYCTTLIEAQEIEHQEKAELFKERAWYPNRYHMVEEAPPAARTTPASQPAFEVPERFPAVVEDMDRPAHGSSMMDHLSRYANGRGSGAMAVAWLALLWASVHLSGIA